MAARAVVRRHGIVLPAYALIAVLFTYPLILHLTTAVAGRGDVLENYWNLWWIGESLLHRRQNPFVMTVIHHPFGMPLYFHTLNLINGLVGLPVQACCGTALAFNLLYLWAFVMAALGAYALVWYVTRSRTAAWIGGLIYAFSPYMTFHLIHGQSNLVSLEWMPFYVLLMLLGLRKHWGYLPAAALALLLNALTDWHYLVFMLIITGVVVIYEAVRLRRPRELGGLVAKTAFLGAIFTALIAPVLLPTLREAMGDGYAVRPLEHSISHSADLLAFLLPNPFHPIWGTWASNIFNTRLVLPGVLGGIASVGFSTLVLAIGGTVGNVRRAMLFALIALVAAVLALGPYLQIGGVNSGMTDRPVPLPYLVFYRIPFMNALRVPSRFVAVVMLALAVLAGLGVSTLQHRIARSSVPRRALLPLLTLLVLFENWPQPFGRTPIGPELVPAFFQQLSADPAEYALIEVPYRSPQPNFYQTYHHKSSVGGRIARSRPHPWSDARFFGPLIQTKAPAPEIGADDGPAAWQSALACQNVRYVVFYKNDLDARQREAIPALQEALFPGVRPVYEDETVRAYGPLAKSSDDPFWTPLHKEWWATETTADGGLRYRWMKGERGSLQVYPCGRTPTTLRFTAFAYAQARTLEVRLNGQLVHTAALARETLTPVEVPLELRDGENTVELRSVEPAVSPAQMGTPLDDRLLSLNISQVSIRPREP